MPQTRIVPTKPVFVLEGKKKSIVVADIHIGFENSMASNEIFIGKNSTTNESIQEITEIIDLEKPDSVILTGRRQVKHKKYHKKRVGRGSAIF